MTAQRRRCARTLRAVTFVLAACTLATGARAGDAYPERPVRVVIGTPAGSTTDFLYRALQDAVREELGQPIVIENRPGADQLLAARQVAGAAGDGYTLLAATRTQVAVNPVTYANPGYDADRDLVPVTLLAYQIMLVVVHPTLPVRTLAELAAYTRAHPNAVNYGSGSASLMLAGEALKAAIGADMTHIPYNGIAPAMNALLAGDVQVGLVDVTAALPSIRAERVRALVVSGGKRFASLPDVPTFREAGYANADMPLWNALFAPAGTPDAIVARVHAAFVHALESPGVAERLLGAGVVPETTTPEGLRTLVARERAEVAALVKRLGIPPR